MNSRLEYAIQKLLDIGANSKLNPEIREAILDAAQNIMRGHVEYEEQLRELRELLYRNPAFPDDLMGYWDDDLPDEDDDEEQ